MKLVAIMSWYDEPVWCLTELVASLVAAGVDHIVAVDGAYMLYPNGQAQSPLEQAQAILAAAAGAGIAATVHLPQDVWFGNEIEKRSYAFELAETIAVPDEDWFWIVDADERVQSAMGLRAALERTEYDVASLMMDEVNGGSREGVVPMRKFFRAQKSGIRLRNNHFTFYTGDGELLYEGFQTPREELAACDHFAFVRIDHRGGRSRLRDHAAQVYYDRRKQTATELVPG